MSELFVLTNQGKSCLQVNTLLKNTFVFLPAQMSALCTWFEMYLFSSTQPLDVYFT